MKLRSKKGLTLVELIVTVAFTAVVMAAACTALYAAADSSRKASANATGQQSVSLAESYLRRYAAVTTSVSPNSGDVKGKPAIRLSLTANGEEPALLIEQKVSSTETWQRTALVDNIAQLQLTVQEDGSLGYAISSQDTAYTYTASRNSAFTQSGGIVLNNCSGLGAYRYRLTECAVYMVLPADSAAG